MSEDKKGISAAQWAAFASIMGAVLVLCGTLAGLALNCNKETGNIWCAPTQAPGAVLPQFPEQTQPPGQTAPPAGGGEMSDTSGTQAAIAQTEFANQANLAGTQVALTLTFAAGANEATQAAVAATLTAEASDIDGDGLTYSQELNIGTRPSNPDSDGDGVFDGQEQPNGLNPTNPDSDGDGLNDGQEFSKGTSPTNSDSDGDGLLDGQETNSNPLDPDSDDDGWNDGREASAGTSPTNPDTDGDGLLDNADDNPLVSPPACQHKTFTYSLASSMEFKPQNNTKGDKDFSGNGPSVVISVNLRPVIFSKTKFVFNLEVSMSAIETISDFTTISDSWVQENAFIVQFDSGYEFEDYISRYTDELHYTDYNNDPDTKLPDNSNGLGPVNKFIVVGDTDGNDLGKTKVTIYFNPLKFKIKQVSNCK